MSNKEALANIRKLRELYALFDGDTFSATCEMAISALEKQIPKKPKETAQITKDEFTFMCCNCGRATSVFHNLKIEYCPHCGQAID